MPTGTLDFMTPQKHGVQQAAQVIELSSTYESSPQIREKYLDSMASPAILIGRIPIIRGDKREGKRFVLSTLRYLLKDTLAAIPSAALRTATSPRS